MKIKFALMIFFMTACTPAEIALIEEATEEVLILEKGIIEYQNMPTPIPQTCPLPGAEESPQYVPNVKNVNNLSK